MNQIISSAKQTMSSREIADLVGLRHDNVKRTIKSLAKNEVIQLPQIEEVKNHLGQTVTVFQVCKRDSFVVAQLSPEFTARRLLIAGRSLSHSGVSRFLNRSPKRFASPRNPQPTYRAY